MSLKRPGFGLPLEHLPQWKRPSPGDKSSNTRFPHAIADFFATPGVTLRELRMLDFINQITDKPRWWEKIEDEAIVANWREEACGSEDEQRYSDRHLDIKSFEYCMDELQDKATYLLNHGVVHVLDIAATIVKKDLDTNDSFWAALISAANTLEDVPDRMKDWHPGSNELVLDLLHPSLFPLQYGKSRVLPNCTVPIETCAEYIGMGEICVVPDILKHEGGYSKAISWRNESSPMKAWGSFQWLPSEITFSSEGSAKIASYVNNLHPEIHPGLYKVLEAAVDKAVPLWNECLSWFHNRLRIVPSNIGYESYESPDYPGYTQSNPAATSNEIVGEQEQEEDWNNWQHPHEIGWDQEVHWKNWLRDNPNGRRLIQPFADKYTPIDETFEEELINLRSDFPEGLQIIFKLANIHLTVENPLYEGSNWHVEGCLNEHIAATALFYYDSENITDNYLEFRQHVDAEEMVMKPVQHEYDTVEDMYGVAQEGSAVQELGKVSTKTGRFIAFPNVLQHQVSSFQLQDPTKPGHRKILAMFLIDPHIKILSTANVPPQRLDWWAVEVRKVARFAALPVELFDRIMEFVEDFPISWEDACDAREDLMEERGRVTEDYNQTLEEDTFYFCEH